MVLVVSANHLVVVLSSILDFFLLSRLCLEKRRDEFQASESVSLLLTNVVSKKQLTA